MSLLSQNFLWAVLNSTLASVQPEARLLEFLLGDRHWRRLRIVQTQAELRLASQPTRVNTIHPIFKKGGHRQEASDDNVYWLCVLMTANQRTGVKDNSREETTVCSVITKELKTSAVQNRGSDYNVVYRESNFPDELSPSVSNLVLQYFHLLGLLHTVNLHVVIKVNGIS